MAVKLSKLKPVLVKKKSWTSPAFHWNTCLNLKKKEKKEKSLTKIKIGDKNEKCQLY